MRHPAQVMKVHLLSICLLAGVFAAGCTTKPVASSQPQNDGPDEATTRLLRAVTQAETYRTHSVGTGDDERRDKNPKDQDAYIGLWPIDKRGPTMNRDYAQRVAAFLLDRSNFLEHRSPGDTKRCIFDPGVIIRLRSGKDTIDVVICFKCAQLSVDSTQSRLWVPSADFDPGYAKLAALAKEAFPHDKAIVALPS
jgi:hypothetical protein